ncbi:hypothetical protein, partial [Anaerotruncus colihominis]|uniref:hypothetical protein n=1 Tax=Anaerotruncus colihominis TaxID=169435 RepID=UPI00210AE481
IFLALIEGSSTASTILGLDPPELRAGVAISAPGRAPADVIPVHTHESLPVGVIPELICFAALAVERGGYDRFLYLA